MYIWYVYLGQMPCRCIHIDAYVHILYLVCILRSDTGYVYISICIFRPDIGLEYRKVRYFIETSLHLPLSWVCHCTGSVDSTVRRRQWSKKSWTNHWNRTNQPHPSRTARRRQWYIYLRYSSLRPKWQKVKNNNIFSLAHSGFTHETITGNFPLHKFDMKSFFNENVQGMYFFLVTFWDLSPALSIDLMWQRKGFLWKYGGFWGYS